MIATKPTDIIARQPVAARSSLVVLRRRAEAAGVTYSRKQENALVALRLRWRAERIGER